MNHIDSDEMESVITLCRAMDDLWEASRKATRNGFIEVDDDQMFGPVNVYDGTGAVLGQIAMGESLKFALYFPEEPEGDKENPEADAGQVRRPRLPPVLHLD